MTNYLAPTAVPILHRSRSFRTRSGLPPSPPPISRDPSGTSQGGPASSQQMRGSLRSVFSMSDDGELVDELFLISLASSFTDVRVDATPRIDVKELPLVGEEEMNRRERDHLVNTGLPRPFQVIKARVYSDDPDFARPVWKVVEQPRENLRAGDSIYVSLKESDGFALHYAEAFTIVGEPVCMEHATEVQLMSSAGVHTPITLLLKTEWFAEERIPATMESALRKFWNKLRCGGGGMVN